MAIVLSVEIALGALLALGMFGLRRRYRAETLSHARELERLSDLDGLTGLGNLRALVRDLALALHRSRRTREPVTVLWLDLEGFGDVNGRHGHAEGDRTLRAMGAVARSSLRYGSDAGYRVGGDEFAVLLVGDREAAQAVGRRLEWNFRERTPRASGLSMGLAPWNGRSSPEGLIEEARRAPRARPAEANVVQMA